MAKKGIKFTEEHKRKLSEAHRGKKVSKETRDKLRLFNLGKKASEETREKMRLSHKGKHKYWLGKKFSEKHKAKMKASAKKGKDNNMWKGGVSSENEKQRKTLGYKFWRKACFERDNFTCQKTGISGGKLVVHHINNFADFPELRTAIDNGITLSDKAHKEFHKIYGIKNNTKEQLIEFLNIDSKN